jgi:hypothetical protein
MAVKEIKLKPVKTKEPKGVKAGMPKTSPGVQGPAMIVKKRDGNRPVKIY